jgi:hypothetical protein
MRSMGYPMNSSHSGPQGVVRALLTACLACLVLLPGAAARAGTVGPRVTTGGVQHVRGTAALLTGNVTPNGTDTMYYFQYGPTTAYGTQTPTVDVGSGNTKVRVGQSVTHLVSGTTYHYRIVGLPAGKPPIVGHDKTFIAGHKHTGLTFKFAKTTVTQVFGRSFLISGTLSGTGAGNHAVALQASPYPYLEPFENVGAAGSTNGAGAFSFRVSHLALSTQFRVVTLDKLPIYSPIYRVSLAVHVNLHVAKTKRTGYVRLYGTVAPARNGAHVSFQLQRAARPHGKNESSVRLQTVATTKLKRGGHTYSRFSSVVQIHTAGHYRAAVKLGKGPYASGASSYVTIRTVAPATKRGHHKRAKKHKKHK